MVDTVTITHTTATPVDDAINAATGKTVPSAGETPATTYTGAAFISPTTSVAAKPGQAPVGLDAYTLVLPFDAPEPTPGDQATVTASAAEPALVGLILVVLSAEAHTLNLARVVSTQVLTPARPVHGR